MDCHNIAGSFSVLFYFSAQMRNVNMDVVYTSLILTAPYIRQDPVKGKQLPTIARQIDQQSKLDGRQFDAFPMKENFVSINVNAQVPVVIAK